MIRVSALERVLADERLRRQTSRHMDGNFAVPVLQEVTVPADAAPFVVTNMRGSFVLTPRSLSGKARYGFTESSLEQDGQLLSQLYRVLWQLSSEHEWPTRCTTIAEAASRMGSYGMEPEHVIVSIPLLEEACGTAFSIEDAEKTMAAQGFITEVNGLRVLAADLPPGAALVTTTPKLTGFYTRVDNRVGVMIQRANRSVMLVQRAQALPVGDRNVA